MKVEEGVRGLRTEKRMNMKLKINNKKRRNYFY